MQRHDGFELPQEAWRDRWRLQLLAREDRQDLCGGRRAEARLELLACLAKTVLHGFLRDSEPLRDVPRRYSSTVLENAGFLEGLGGVRGGPVDIRAVLQGFLLTQV